MKQLLVIVLTLCYSFSSVGATLHFHYCGKLLQYVSFDGQEKDTCCGKEGKKHGCCSDTIVKGDVDDYKQAITFLFTLKKAVDDILIFEKYIPHTRSVYAQTHTSYKTLPPPPLIPTHIYKENCVFLI